MLMPVGCSQRHLHRWAANTASTTATLATTATTANITTPTAATTTTATIQRRRRKCQQVHNGTADLMYIVQ